ncbi:MAG: site-specific integrase [Enterococcus faecalis]|jgi:integrase|uniref:tyrosine-type recombinase/integrase n=1 Tax=Enterococcus faecalis TaxID=1351 RepID=UPI0006663AEB|nr:site-specific integrase [Enterococcus faecalis]DAF82943.1 MAG TPA: Integrase [Caudoviricetes sp.]EGO6739171.1 site-specific integrase [Enterococcus faecalis]EHK9417728.1 site-specific integrase [Enterococcus faecalis]EKL7633982.1 site-specific integrase [Enterococcus faecalis]MBF0020385.1 site-specific integrase [Enterococcus faecalis]
MASIKKYTKKDGSTAYMFNAYLGVDPVTGKSRRTTRRGFRTQKEAKLALSRLELEVDSKGFVKQNYSTFKDVYELWYAQYVNTVKPITAGHTERMFRLHILPEFGNIKINKLTKLMCQKAVNKWSKEYSAFYLLKSITQKMLHYAVAQDIIDINPMQYVVMPKKDKTNETKKKQFLELSELKDFLAEAKETLNFQDYLIFRVLAFTGIRKGELYALTWEDINISYKQLTVNKTLTRIGKEYIISTPKTKASNRTIGLDDTTVSELIIWKKHQKQELLKYGFKTKSNDKQLIFHRKNNTLHYPEHINFLLLSEMKTSLSPHSFRHTHASLLFESGATIKDVQKRLGHTNVNTTMDIYTHVTKSSERKAIDKLSNYANF